jgi:hypothetical protein
LTLPPESCSREGFEALADAGVPLTSLAVRNLLDTTFDAAPERWLCKFPLLRSLDIGYALLRNRHTVLTKLTRLETVSHGLHIKR